MGFNSLEEAWHWVDRFVNWYNNEHKHSKLRFVTPYERHSGEDAAILAQRQRVLEQAKRELQADEAVAPSGTVSLLAQQH